MRSVSAFLKGGALGLFMLSGTAVVSHAQCVEVAGTWRINDSGIFPGTLQLSQSGCSISGVINFDDGEVNTINGSTSGSAITFVDATGGHSCVTGQEVSALFSGTVSANASSMSGYYAYDCGSFPWTARLVYQPYITSPSDGASPQSQFAAISGTGTPGDTLNVLVGGFSVGSVVVDSEGNWEALPYVSLYGSSVTLRVQDQTSSNYSNTITVHPSLAAFLPGPSSPPNSLTALLPLRKAAIFLLASDTSPQHVIYGPNYTHTALYLGGDIMERP